MKFEARPDDASGGGSIEEKKDWWEDFKKEIDGIEDVNRLYDELRKVQESLSFASSRDRQENYTSKGGTIGYRMDWDNILENYRNLGNKLFHILNKLQNR